MANAEKLGGRTSGGEGAEEEGKQAELPDRVQVYARKRPMLGEGEDAVQVDESAHQFSLKQSNTRATASLKDSRKMYTFDHVFSSSASQEEVYSTVAQPMVADVMRGYHACVLAYGQTGSGKTHSLLNPGETGAEDAGIVPRLFSELFARAAADHKKRYEVHAAMFQVYNEQVDDLLKRKHNLRVAPDRSGGWQVENLSWFKAKSANFLMQIFNNGRKSLVHAETHMNKQSSRSHAVLQLAVRSLDAPLGNSSTATTNSGAETPDEDTEHEVMQTQGLLTVVDLAGSERVKKSRSEGQRFQEATNINTSLHEFGNCVQALAEKRQHVPFRNSVLTKMLEKSLSGKARTSLLVCVSPHADSISETTSTLEFAQRAMRIDVQPEAQQSKVNVSANELADALGDTHSFGALEEAREKLNALEEELRREQQRREEQERRARGLEVELEAEQKEAQRAASEAAEAKSREEAARREAEERAERERATREECEVAAKKADEKATELAEVARRANEAEAEARRKQAELAEKAEELANVRKKLAEEQQDEEELKRRESELMDELETLRQQAEAAAEEAASLAAQLSVSRAAHEAESCALRQQIEEQTKELMNARDATERANTRLAEIERQLSEKASHAARLESSLSGQKAAVKALQRELREARGGTAMAEATLLRSGVAATKLSRKGKPLSRLLRFLPETERLEWAPVGPFRNGMGVTDATIEGSDEGKQLIIRGASRTVDVDLGDGPETESIRAWAKALTSLVQASRTHSEQPSFSTRKKSSNAYFGYRVSNSSKQSTDAEHLAAPAAAETAEEPNEKETDDPHRPNSDEQSQAHNFLQEDRQSAADEAHPGSDYQQSSPR